MFIMYPADVLLFSFRCVALLCSFFAIQLFISRKDTRFKYIRCKAATQLTLRLCVSLCVKCYS